MQDVVLESRGQIDHTETLARTAAAEALTVVVKTYVFPSSTITDKGILREPIEGNLSRYFSAWYIFTFVKCSGLYRRFYWIQLYPRMCSWTMRRHLRSWVKFSRAQKLQHR